MRRAGDILKLFLDQATAEKAERYHGFFSGWEQVVGERIAAHSQIKDIDNGTVIVEVDHPGWIQMIQLKQSRFVEVLRRRYPDLEIRGLRLQLPWESPHPVPGPRRRAERSESANEGPGRQPAAGGPEVGGPAGDREQPGAPRVDGGIDGRPEAGEPGATEEEAPADPMIRGALERLGRAIEERDEP